MNKDHQNPLWYIPQDNLCFVPVLPHRLNFAVLVRKAVCQLQHKFGPLNLEDLVAVSLPTSIGPSLTEATNKLPRVSLITASIKDLDGTDYREVYPVVPNDGIIEAVRIANDNNPKIHVEFIDREINPAHLAARTCASDPYWPDDALALKFGPQEYLKIISNHLAQPPNRFEPVATWREQHMAGRLRRLQPQYRRIIVVCDAVHVTQIIQLLQSSSDETSISDNSISETKLLVQEPVIDILLKYLDDFPKVVDIYESERTKGCADEFDKRATILALLNDVESFDHYTSATIRELQKCIGFLVNLLRHERRITPSPTVLFDAVDSCLNQDFSKALQASLISYKNQISAETARHVSLISQDEIIVKQTVENSNNIYVSRSCNGQPEYYRKVVEKETENSTGTVFHSWPPYEDFINKMRRKCYQVLGEISRKKRTAKFHGSLGLGIDPRRTLKSYWRQMPSMYIKEPIFDRLSFNIEREPIVWLFEVKDESNMSIMPWMTGGGENQETYCDYITYHRYSRIKKQYPAEGLTVKYFSPVHGFLLFCDIGINISSKKAEFGDEFDERIPILNDIEHQISSSNHPWWEKLLLIALQYAKQTVICYLPENYNIPPHIMQQSQNKKFVRLPKSIITYKERDLIRWIPILSTRGYDAKLDYNDPEWIKFKTEKYGRLMRRFWNA